MRIIIVGAGEVGYHIASRLASENKKVTVIDKNPDAARSIADDLDVQTIVGLGDSPIVLENAGINEAEILLAVTDSDETNLVACLIANMISPATRKLARIRHADFDDYHDIFRENAPYIDKVINPEIEVVNTIVSLMQVPGAVDVGSFVDGKVKFAGIRIDSNSPMANVRLVEYGPMFGDERPLIAAIVRKGRVIVPRGTDKLEQGDLVYFVSESHDIVNTVEKFGKEARPLKRVIIVGGGRTGLRLARVLEKMSVQTKIVEADFERCRELSEQMDKTVVLHGDASEENLFIEENVSDVDAVVSLTNHDETNILVSLLANSMGARSTITKISRIGYTPLISKIGLHKVVSPRLSAVRSILRDVRKGKVLSAISVLGEEAEFIEAVALETSDITARPLKKLSFPKGAILVCIIRNGTIIIPSGESKVAPNDRIIIFTRKESVKKLEKLLTVKLEYF